MNIDNDKTYLENSRYFLNLGILLTVGLGALGYLNLGADLLPALNVPVITITTTYPGAGTAEIETDVVKPVEDAVSGISRIDTLSSGSAEGYGYTTIIFRLC